MRDVTWKETNQVVKEDGFVSRSTAPFNVRLISRILVQHAMKGI